MHYFEVLPLEMAIISLLDNSYRKSKTFRKIPTPSIWCSINVFTPKALIQFIKFDKISSIFDCLLQPSCFCMKIINGCERPYVASLYCGLKIAVSVHTFNELHAECYFDVIATNEVCIVNYRCLISLVKSII